jgi:shikimate kinase
MRLALPFIDTDHVIEQRIGCSIREFFEREGEAAFRDLEHEVLADLSRGRPACSPPAAAPCCASQPPASCATTARGLPALLARGTVAAPAPRHPAALAAGGRSAGRLRHLFAERDPLYREVADFVIETGRPSVPTLVNMVVMQLELAGVLPLR